MARPFLVSPWGPLLEEPLALRQHLLAQEREQDQAPGPPASSLAVAVLACFKPQKVCLPPPSIPTRAYQFPAEALDQWFENLQNYEATLVRLTQLSTEASFLTSHAGRHGRRLVRCKFQGRIKRHRAM